MANRWGNNGKSDTLFSWAPKSLQMVIAAMKLKDTCIAFITGNAKGPRSSMPGRGMLIKYILIKDELKSLLMKVKRRVKKLA